MATIALNSALTHNRNNEIMSKALDIQNNTQPPHQGFQIPLYTVLHLFFQLYFPSHTQANSVISRGSEKYIIFRTAFFYNSMLLFILFFLIFQCSLFSSFWGPGRMHSSRLTIKATFSSLVIGINVNLSSVCSVSCHSSFFYAPFTLCLAL